MSKNKTKFKSNFTANPLLLQVIHLSLKDINSNDIEKNGSEEIVAKELRQKIRKIDLINDIKLDFFKIDKTNKFNEEKNVFRYNTSINCELSDLNGIKKVLRNICKEDKLCNTLFSPNFETIKWLSQIYRLIPKQTFKITSFSFGTIIDLTRFVEHYNCHRNGQKLNVAKDDIMADFEHDKKRLLLKFRLTSGGNHGKHTKNIRYKLEYEYKSINSAIISVDNEVVRIYFTLNHPPLSFKVQSDDESYEEKYNRNIDTERYFGRKHKDYNKRDNNEGVHNNEVPNYAYWLRENEFEGCDPQTIGKCNVLMIEMKQLEDPKKLKDKYTDDKIPDPWRLPYIMQIFHQIQTHFAHISSHISCDNNYIKDKLFGHFETLLRSKDEEREKREFAIKYAYRSVFAHTFQASDELYYKNECNLFNNTVKQKSEIDSEAIEETLFELSALIDRSAIFCVMNALESIFNESNKRNLKMTKENNIFKSSNPELVYIRRCILTPTRFLILPPQPTLKSRFIENSDPDFTIRLTVREDDLLGLCYSVGNCGSRTNQTDFLKKVIKKPLLEGITIGGRIFQFLGSSSSQLRDSGMVLYANDYNKPLPRTASSIRESIGDMSKIRKNVAKYVARLGLAFSQVMTHIPIDENKVKIRVDDDIKSLSPKPNYKCPEILSDEYYNFSDGIGRISKKLVERVYEKLPNECIRNPSAMQIRYGGVKGMLVLDPTLKGEQIIFRESMKKYNSSNNDLGIIKLSAPRPLYLNRPLITILEQLEVKPKVFLSLLMNDLKNLSNSLICECSAIQLLQNSCTLGIPYKKLYNSGYPFLSEPIFRQIVDCVIDHRITELKTKARIKVPMNPSKDENNPIICGRTVFGVLDETNTLDYGQVFVQLSYVEENDVSKDCFILEDEIMVTKFPCLHPGDVRKLTAIDVPALHHIKDCIVFPAKGKRPHPDEMAGSDLDGDEYAVIFLTPKSVQNGDFLIFKGDNKDAMLFPTSKAEELPHNTEVEDILDFYCKYILSNNVGILASAHLANADILKDGIFNDICMSLAEKYAIALDFAKTGHIVDIDRTERPQLYPDFMEKFSTKRTTLSTNILGQIYRQCDRYEMGMRSKTKLEINAEPNAVFELEGWEKYEKSATDAFNAYKEKISYLLNRFGVESEAALLSGAFSKTSKYMTGRTETNDIHELLEGMVNKLFTEFRKRFNNECESDRNNEHKRSLRASAWYLIPFKLNQLSNSHYFGFSWTITEELCKLYNKRDCNQMNAYEDNHDCIHYSTQLIDKYMERNFVYKEPEIDPSITDEGQRRELIMEERCKTAEVVLKAWLERQDHLYYKRKVGRRVVSSIDALMSDMDRKLRRKLIKVSIDVKYEAREHLNKPLRSAGNLIMSFMKESMEEWLEMSSLKDSNRIRDTPLVKFGFSALLTLKHFFKTRQISHIINLNPRFEVSLKTPIKNSTFYIPLPESERNKKFVEYIVRNPEEFCERLKRMSGAIEVILEPYPMRTKKLSYHYLLTASGTVWSLQSIKNFIAHKTFFKNVVNDKNWRQKNLYYRGYNWKKETLNNQKDYN